MEHEITLKVQSADCDNLGHLNHVEAVRYFERGREAWVAAAGLHEEIGGRAGTVIVRIEVDYRLECFVDEPLSVLTRPLRLGTKSYTFAQQLLKADGEVAVRVEATSVVFDLEARRAIPVPHAIASRFPKP